MMSSSDHAHFSALLNQSDVDASEEVLTGAVLSVLSPYGLEFELVNTVVLQKRTDFRIDRVLHLTAPHATGTLGLVVRSMGLPDGRLCVYLVVFRITGRDAPSEECLHIELFRSEPVDDWRTAPDPVAALRSGAVSGGYLDCNRWPQVAQEAALRVDQFLQP